MKTFSLLALLCIAATTAQGTQQRVFVSAVRGDDANVCSVNAPCRSFAAALGAVSTGGEILALDSGGFGPIMITKAVSIVAPFGVEGSITQTAAGQNAITVSAPGATVILRGLSIFGLQVANDGILASSVLALIVDSCSFTGFTFSGIEFTLASQGTMSVNNCAFINNSGNGVVTFGASSDISLFLITNSRMESNGVFGLNLFEGSRGTVRDSSFSHNAGGIIVQTQSTGQTALLDVDRCIVSGNHDGITVTGGGGGGGVENVRVSSSVVVNNIAFGVFSGNVNAHLWSRTNNTVEGNATNGTFTDFFTAN